MKHDWTHNRFLLWSYQFFKTYWLDISFWIFTLVACAYTYIIATNGA